MLSLNISKFVSGQNLDFWNCVCLAEFQKKAERKRIELLNHQSSTIHHCTSVSWIRAYISRTFSEGQNFFHDFDAGSTCSTSWYKFLPYVLMEVPLFEMLIQFNKVKTTASYTKVFFSSSATSISFFPLPPKKYESFKINYKTVKKLGDVLILPIWI